VLEIPIHALSGYEHDNQKHNNSYDSPKGDCSHHLRIVEGISVSVSVRVVVGHKFKLSVLY